MGADTDTMVLPGRDRGFILLIVIWMAALFALITTGYVKAVQAHLRATSSVVQLARAELLADSGMAVAALDLLEVQASSGRQRRFPVNGTPVGCTLSGDDRLTIRLQDAGGRINLNTASDRLLQALFIGLGASRTIASRQADAIIDFRSPADEPRNAGAWKPDYQAANKPLGPKNAPLDTLDELYQIAGFDAALIEAMAPHVTIHSGTAGLDPDVTSPVLAELLARGMEDLPASQRGLNSADRLPGEFIVASSRRVYVATIAAQIATVSYVREAAIELLQNRNGLPVYKVWRRGKALPSTGGAEVSVPPPC